MKKTTQLIAVLALTSLIITGCALTETKPKTTQTEAQEGREESIQYLPYSDELYNNFLTSNNFALFFYAEWSTDSRTMEKNILNEMDSFPNRTKIIKADFDKETELKDKYKITTDSTIVIINKEGELTETFTNPTVEELITALTI